MSALFKGKFSTFFLPICLFIFWPDILIVNVFWDCSLCLSFLLQRTSPVMMPVNLLANLRTKKLAWLKKNRPVYLNVVKYSILSDFQPPKIKSLTVSIVSPSICHEMMGAGVVILVFWMLSFKPAFSISSFTFIRGSWVPLRFLP